LKKSKSTHKKIIDKIEGLRDRIMIGHPLPTGGKMVDQDAENELLLIAGWYNGDIGGISNSDIKELIKAFEKCDKLRFWYSCTEKEIKKAISNLKGYLEKKGGK